MSEKIKHEIEEVKEWVKGEHIVREFISKRTGNTRYLGMAMITQSMNTPNGVVQRDVPMTFDVVANDIGEAFKYFEDAQNNKLKEIKLKESVPKIIRAN